MKFLKLFIIIIFFFSINACNKGKNEEKKDSEPIVKVFDHYLYSSDIEGLVSNGTSYEDSINIVDAYINNWIQDKLMLYYAESSLQDKKDEIDKKTEDFKNSLFVHMFKEKLLEINSDSITNEELIEYYEKHNNEFRLGSDIIKGFYVKISGECDELSRIKKVLKTSDETDIDELLGICKKNGGYFEDFTQNWIRVPEIMDRMPINRNDYSYLVKSNRYIESSDNENYYFLFISDYTLEGEIAPFEYVVNDIKKIVKQKQNTEIIDNFKQDKYNEALKHGDIQFF